jgi:prefoldin subunit 5
MTLKELAAEHQRLKAQVAELQREHDALSGDGRDSAHVEHRIKLQHKIAELEAHMAHLRASKASL